MAVVGQIGRNACQIRTLASPTSACIVLAAHDREGETAAPRYDRGRIPASRKEIREMALEPDWKGPNTREVEHVLQIVVGRSAVVVLIIRIGDVGSISFIRGVYVVVDGLGERVVARIVNTLLTRFSADSCSKPDALQGRF